MPSAVVEENNDEEIATAVMVSHFVSSVYFERFIILNFCAAKPYNASFSTKLLENITHNLNKHRSEKGEVVVEPGGGGEAKISRSPWGKSIKLGKTKFHNSESETVEGLQ